MMLARKASSWVTGLALPHKFLTAGSTGDVLGAAVRDAEPSLPVHYECHGEEARVVRKLFTLPHQFGDLLGRVEHNAARSMCRPIADRGRADVVVELHGLTLLVIVINQRPSRMPLDTSQPPANHIG
jgi:hypothetical protein